VVQESIIQNLFPIPVYINNINREFTKKELKFANEQKNSCVSNKGNTSSNNKYVLNKPELKEIKNFLNQCCNDYLQKIISPKNNLNLYITQSWLNYTMENQFHHSHNHANSVVSGVLYFDCNNKNDIIRFLNPMSYQQIKPEVQNYNLWNSDTWWFPVEIGQLIMFPSSTVHEVDNKKSSNNRISLAFNTFYKGTIGSNIGATELIL